MKARPTGLSPRGHLHLGHLHVETSREPRAWSLPVPWSGCRGWEGSKESCLRGRKRAGQEKMNCEGEMAFELHWLDAGTSGREGEAGVIPGPEQPLQSKGRGKGGPQRQDPECKMAVAGRWTPQEREPSNPALDSGAGTVL